jgi:hypothetical protein
MGEMMATWNVDREISRLTYRGLGQTNKDNLNSVSTHKLAVLSSCAFTHFTKDFQSENGSSCLRNTTEPVQYHKRNERPTQWSYGYLGRRSHLQSMIPVPPG